MRIGYARASTQDQSLDLQRDALKAAGCGRVIADTISGATAARPGLDRVRELLRAGDTLVVWRLDRLGRLGRSLKDLIASVAWLEEHGVALLSLQETIDTSTPAGRLTFHLFGALAEFERNLIRERTQAASPPPAPAPAPAAVPPPSTRPSAASPSSSTRPAPSAWPRSAPP